MDAKDGGEWEAALGSGDEYEFENENDGAAKSGVAEGGGGPYGLRFIHE
jgi:hypothetical protein